MLSKLFLKENIGITKVLAAFLCLGGTFAILRPDFFRRGFEGGIYYLLAIATGISIGVGVIIKQRSPIRHLNTALWLFWHMALSSIAFLLLVFTKKIILFELSPRDIGFLSMFILGSVGSRTLHILCALLQGWLLLYHTIHPLSLC